MGMLLSSPHALRPNWDTAALLVYGTPASLFELALWFLSLSFFAP